MYNIDSNEGGDLTLHKHHRLDGKKEDTKDLVPADTSGKYELRLLPLVAFTGVFFCRM